MLSLDLTTMNAKMVTESVGHGPAQNSEPSSYNHSAEVSANESVSSPFEVWSPSSHELSIMVVLSILSLMVSLDASVIVTSLNVSGSIFPMHPSSQTP